MRLNFIFASCRRYRWFSSRLHETGPGASSLTSRQQRILKFGSITTFKSGSSSQARRGG